ncbi:MAG: L-threonylcarbamoyladenylate synthase [Planctomycetota bacterium]
MNTKVLKPDSQKDYQKVIREAADCLTKGGLVAFPTETVYGLGANALNASAMDRLHEIKNRPKDKPFTVHIGSRSVVDRFVPNLEGLGRRLTLKAWPGPLTLIFNVTDIDSAPVIQESSPEHVPAMYHEGTIGIRCPDNEVAAALLGAVGVPVVAASANPAGAPAPVDAEEVLSAFKGQVDIVIDAGTTRYAKCSTIVQVNGNSYTILREGVLDQRTVYRLSMVNFLLVCSGNTCRSPMAAGLLRRMLAQRIGCRDDELEDHGYHVESAGTAAFTDSGASGPALKAMHNRGIDISGHRSQPLKLEQINRSDYIFTMTGYHMETVKSVAADAGGQAKQIDDQDIEDPIGGSDEVYENCAQRIEKALQSRLEEITL